MLAGGGRAKTDGVNQILSSIGSLLNGNQNGGQGLDLSMISSVIESFTSSSSPPTSEKEKRNTHEENNSIDFENVMNIASMFLTPNGNNAEGIMGMLPMLLENFMQGGSGTPGKKHDHSGHSWYMPPILENLHLMWDHFRYKI